MSQSKPSWSPNSWRNQRILHQPSYVDPQALQQAVGQLTAYPPLVSIGEIQRLRHRLAEANEHKRFVLQGGDCAERFVDAHTMAITNKIKILLQMSVILTYGARKPIIRIGRMAGQYGKPRSNPTESVNDQEMLTYRGDAVNDFQANPKSREPDPQRLLQAYHHSAITLNYIRAIISGGFADLHYPYNWNLHAIENSPLWPEYQAWLDRILDAINFMESVGAAKEETLGNIDFYVSHEGLLLEYEEALTRKDPDSGHYYNIGAHTLWIGERTRALDSAHIEYFRGVQNPLGIKVGPKTDPKELVELTKILNPNNAKGRLTLVTRMGAQNIEEALPPLIRAIQKEQRQVIWSCDPMHGNMKSTSQKQKTRDFDDILSEIQQSFRLHRENQSYLGGIHFELTGEDVTECTGGIIGLQEKDLLVNYQSYCDPRLNYTQSMEMAFLLAKLMNQ